MNPITKFENEVEDNIRRLSLDNNLTREALDWMLRAGKTGSYTYNFSWFSRPIIQYPQDMVAMQEIIWNVKPDLIIETGIAHGGSLIMNASYLAMLDYCDAVIEGRLLDPANPSRKVLGIDIDIREHNRLAIQAHPMASRIEMIQGSSIASETIAQVREFVGNYKNVLVCLDSMHTHNHVLAELKAYAPLVAKDSYCVVFDTIIEDMPADSFPDRPWGKGNNPKTAVWEFLRENSEFEIDKSIPDKLQITVAPDGFLKRVCR
ncbi:MAG: cephalosporin hydroxylase [Candidatus Wallbacteria bacterium HGW-Wallbacteria-1]|jgi:cephalosporin hydroxylase|uniref:Cephalosporin hydroxylase n=1 Tax=Candidatus Wallbacteria bacterium HGW-Wallbacteria-1 TaxID=2013854 RepID=A0A2N1PN10_9BACT|nr:MAG: cephalosporin hydroxylase [Candidatus Wallbacteria bacterium HGW-Wallbacteria-1]